MNTFISGPLSDNARNLMRRVGYGEHRGRDGQTSFTRRLHGAMYPRFHAYVEDRDGGMQLNLHLDQKEASYEGSRAHSGEYDGPLVERESARIVETIKSLVASQESIVASSVQTRQKRGFFGWLLGD
jgi:hypothetical protein